MNMQQMIIQAQKMQRELKKAQAELEKQEFTVTKGGAVTVKMTGAKQVVSIEIDEDAFEKENKEMIQDMVALAINELITTIQKASDDIQEKITGQSGGLGF